MHKIHRLVDLLTHWPSKIAGYSRTELDQGKYDYVRKLARNYMESDLRFDFLSLVVSDLVKMGETSGKQGPKHMHIYKPDYEYCMPRTGPCIPLSGSAFKALVTSTNCNNLQILQ